MSFGKASLGELEKPAADEAPSYRQKDPHQFHYRSLNPIIKEIRLVTILPPSPIREVDIECCLSYAPLEDAPAYEALSYTWADKDGDSSLSSKIILDGFSFTVTKNLEAALRQLRLPSDKRVLWIDAICIEQTNDAERNHQVAMMRTIYEKAKEVPIWLGSESEKSDLAFEFLHGALERVDAETWVQNLLTDLESVDFLHALALLFVRPYWGRIWIVQEVFSARNRTVYCGSDSISWANLTGARGCIIQQMEAIRASRVTYPVFIRVMYTEGPMSVAMPQHIVTQGRSILLETLLEYREKSSTDPRDKVYGIAGLAVTPDDPVFTVDYSRSVSEIYKDVVKHVITATRDLDIISVAKGLLHPDWLPSWAPDWSKSTPIIRISACSRGFDAALGRPAEAIFNSADSVLRVRGISAGMIESVAMPFHDNELLLISYESYNFYQVLLAICSWHELAKERLPEAFYEVIRIGPYADHEYEGDGVLVLESFAALIEQYMPKHPLDGLLQAALLRWQKRAENNDTLAEIKDACCTVEEIADYLNGRRFFVSSTGQMGLAPYRAEVGDIICVLFGSHCPVILRPQDGYHIVVGEAYVYGLMYGEAMEGLSDGKYTIQEFELH